MTAVAASGQTQEGVRGSVSVAGKRKLEDRNRLKLKNSKTKRQGHFETHKRAKKVKGRRKPLTFKGRLRDDDEEEESPVAESSSEESGESSASETDKEVEEGQEEGNDGSESADEETDGGTQKGITKFTHGCRAFKMAFTKIVKKSGQADSLLGPILSAHPKLVVKKLAEDEEQKTKVEVKKKRHLAAERGHVKPASFLDSREKFLISVATKGVSNLCSKFLPLSWFFSVVKLFNAVQKAQNPQKDLNPSRSKDAKQLASRKKETFFSELKKPIPGLPSSAGNDGDEPGWAPLRDSYLLTSSKLKDWDKLENPSNSVGEDIVQSESSDDDD